MPSNAHHLIPSVFPWTGQTDGTMKGKFVSIGPNSKYDATIRYCSNPGSLIVSLSNGSLSLLTPLQSSSSSSPASAIQETWHAHDHEPWVVAWNYWDTNVVFSGEPTHFQALDNKPTR